MPAARQRCWRSCICTCEMKRPGPGAFGTQLKKLRESAGFTQEELATIAGLSVHAVSALERGERRRPHVDTVRALSAALDLTAPAHDALLQRARGIDDAAAVDQLTRVPLPLPLTALVGRESEMETLRLWLLEANARLIAIVGPGGVGKTRLALELARSVAEEGETRVVFAPLAAIRDPGLAACAIAEALGLADISASDLPGRARAACDGCPTLLVIDNLEQIVDAVPLVTDLLASASTLGLVVTSRAPLRIRGEREYVLGPLELSAASNTMPPADLARIPAVRLFVERVRDVQADFQLTSANAPTVVAICRRLDALPLALELAAPWMKVLTAEDLLRRLEQDVLLSAIAPRDLPERQQTMNAAVAWSYQLLSPKEQRAFRRFGALSGRFSLEAACAVLSCRDGGAIGRDVVLDALAGLIDKSLLLRSDTSVTTRPLYQVLETVRAYAVRELTASGERDDALAGLARYCMSQASLATEGLIGPAQGQWLCRVQEDLQNYRGAMTWLIENGRSSEVSDIAWGLLSFWFIRGRAAEGLSWYEDILKLPSLTPTAESRALVGASMMSYVQRQLERARSAAERGVALAGSAGDAGLVAMAEMLLGHVAYAADDMFRARDHFGRSLSKFRALALPWGMASALTGLAVVALSFDDHRDAERLLDEATTVLPRAGPWYWSLVLSVRAILAVQRGDADAAIALVRDTLTHIRELHDKFAFVHALVPLAAAAALKGDDAWAARILGARDDVAERTGAAVVDNAVRDLQGRIEREVRARLGNVAWAEAYAAGRRTSMHLLLKELDDRSRKMHVLE